MCKTKTLIYTFTNGGALDECLDDINLNYTDKEISYININFLKGNILHRNDLDYSELIDYVDIFDSNSKDIDITHSI